MDRILELLRADICYTIKRLLPADLKTFSNLRNYSTDTSTSSCYDNNPFYDEFTIVPNEKYGGITVAPFFIYNRYELGNMLQLKMLHNVRTREHSEYPLLRVFCHFIFVTLI